VKAAAVSWNGNLCLGEQVKDLIIPWGMIGREAHDRGSYITILKLTRDESIPVGSLGTVRFKRGYYLYAGSAMKNLSHRIARHQRRRKNLFWHIDYLRQRAAHCVSLPVRTGADLECQIARALDGISQWKIPGFGASDCRCDSHLFGMRIDPLLSAQFNDLLLAFRIGRLEDELAGLS
jgi:sugar fermentation stimulation protein A